MRIPINRRVRAGGRRSRHWEAVISKAWIAGEMSIETGCSRGFIANCKPPPVQLHSPRFPHLRCGSLHSGECYVIALRPREPPGFKKGKSRRQMTQLTGTVRSGLTLVRCEACGLPQYRCVPRPCIVCKCCLPWGSRISSRFSRSDSQIGEYNRARRMDGKNMKEGCGVHRSTRGIQVAVRGRSKRRIEGSEPIVASENTEWPQR
jgi:hypothetical protein